jgi:UDP-glucose 4-epimerase
MGINEDVLARPVVTGAGGFIGYHVCRILNSDPRVEKIFAIDLANSRNYEELGELAKVTRIAMGLDFNTVEEVISRKPTSAFALAALNGTSRFYSEPFKVLEASTIPTLALLSRLNADCPIVYSSSSEVYASSISLGIGSLPTKEDVPVSIEDIKNPRWSYAAAKMHGEIAVIANSIEKGRPSVIVRYHNVYGSHMGSDHFVPDFISRALRGEYWIENADATRSFLHINDAVLGTIEALLYATPNPEVFNLGNPEELTIRDAARVILKEMGKSNVSLQEKTGPEGSVKRRLPDVSKAKRILNWTSRILFKEGIQDYLRNTY